MSNGKRSVGYDCRKVNIKGSVLVQLVIKTSKMAYQGEFIPGTNNPKLQIKIGPFHENRATRKAIQLAEKGLTKDEISSILINSECVPPGSVNDVLRHSLFYPLSSTNLDPQKEILGRRNKLAENFFGTSIHESTENFGQNTLGSFFLGHKPCTISRPSKMPVLYSERKKELEMYMMQMEHERRVTDTERQQVAALRRPTVYGAGDIAGSGPNQAMTSLMHGACMGKPHTSK